MKFTEAQKEFLRKAFNKFGDEGIRNLDVGGRHSKAFNEFLIGKEAVWDTIPRGYTLGGLLDEIEIEDKYGKELEEAPNCLPSGWAALLELYKIR